MKTNINKLSAASRKRVTRKIINKLRLLRCWHSDALCSANAAEFEGDIASAAKHDAEAARLSDEFHRLEGSIA